MVGSKIDSTFANLLKDRDATLCDEYCEHLKRLGIQAVPLDKKSPEQIPHSIWEWVPYDKKVGSIKIEGKNFQQLILGRSNTKGGGKEYFQHYFVRASVSENEEDLNAHQSRPLFHQSQSQEFTWKGGLLAESLNSDLDLQERLKLCPLYIHVVAKKRSQYVIIENRTTLTRNDFPTAPFLDIIDGIANHIRRMAPPSL
jgi:hypothetical protein